jgi:hypothetical protein
MKHPLEKKIPQLARLIYEAYNDSDLLSVDPDQDCGSIQKLIDKMESDLGDGLFYFLVSEVGTADDLPDALKRLNTVEKQVASIRQMLESLPVTAKKPWSQFRSKLLPEQAAVGPCPYCGRVDHWLNDVPLKAVCSGTGNEAVFHPLWERVVPAPFNPYLPGYDPKAKAPKIKFLKPAKPEDKWKRMT